MFASVSLGRWPLAHQVDRVDNDDPWSVWRHSRSKRRAGTRLSAVLRSVIIGRIHFASVVRLRTALPERPHCHGVPLQTAAEVAMTRTRYAFISRAGSVAYVAVTYDQAGANLPLSIDGNEVNWARIEASEGEIF